MVLNFKSAVVKFEDDWFVAVNGVPTGGIPSVDLGNISVFFVLKQVIYSGPGRPLQFKSENIIFFIRFVDDGDGLWAGDKESFMTWFQNLRSRTVELYGLDFTVDVKEATSFHQFLDIQYKFELNGKLTTDLYRKPTDANRYLEYSSFHPRHVFRSIVYSQGLRYRRIINDDSTLIQRLGELRQAFIRSSYPTLLVDQVLDKIQNLPRSLEYKTTDP